MPAPLLLSLPQARRLALAAQGLLPHLGYRGRAGVEAAVRRMGYLQLDTICVVERSHELALLSRVADYRKQDLWELAYQERRLMEFCEPLVIVPTDEYAYFRTTFPGHDPWHGDADGEALAPIVTRVRAELERRGPLSVRQLEGERMPGGWGVVKDITRAFWRLWYAGEVLTHHRDPNFGRYFDLAARCLPPDSAARPVDESAARRFLARRAVSLLGLASPADFANRLRFLHGLHRGLPVAERRLELEALARDGEVIEARVDGLRDPYVIAPELLELAEACRTPLEGEERVNLLAPLDALLWDRARIARLFGFEYTWEVYKRREQRRWGYYVLPIQWGAELVGRLDPKLDRREGVLTLNGLWFERPELLAEPTFRGALRAAVERFAAFHGATSIQWPAEVDLGG